MFSSSVVSKVEESQISNMTSSEVDDLPSIKLVLVGDGNVGKISMLISYTTDKLPNQYVPTVFDNYLATIKFNGEIIKLWLWDTAGQQEYRRLRPLSYPKTDIFLVCFSMIDPKSYNNMLKKWLPQVEQGCSKALKIVVGTKKDLYRNQTTIDMKGKPQLIQQQVEKKINSRGLKFMTCSALDQQGLNDVFEQAILQVLNKRKAQRHQRKKKNIECQII